MSQESGSKESQSKATDDVNDLALDISVISLHSNDDEEDSVIFVTEEKATHESKQIAKLNQKVQSLLNRNKRLEIHVGALQSKILDQQNPENSNYMVDSVLNNGDLSPSLGMSFDEEWVAAQTEELLATDDLPQLMSEFQNYLEKLTENIEI